VSRRGTETDDTGTFVVEDGRYVSARWPGDAYAFARILLARLDRAERKPAGTA
jgi:putative intracellular protease/amidase